MFIINVAMTLHVWFRQISTFEARCNFHREIERSNVTIAISIQFLVSAGSLPPIWTEKTLSYVCWTWLLSVHPQWKRCNSHREFKRSNVTLANSIQSLISAGSLPPVWTRREVCYCQGKVVRILNKILANSGLSKNIYIYIYIYILTTKALPSQPFLARLFNGNLTKGGGP